MVMGHTSLVDSCASWWVSCGQCKTALFAADGLECRIKFSIENLPCDVAFRKRLSGCHCNALFMVALCNTADHYIFALWFLSSFFLLSFFLAKSQRSEIGCLPYFHTWCGLSANLECMSEMRCTLLAGNTGRKNRRFGTIAQLCRAVSSQLRHVSIIEKKLFKRRYLLQRSS